MGSKTRIWTLLALFLVLGALLAPHSARADAPVAVAVDAIPGGGVDASRAVPDTAPFEVDVVVTAASVGYQGYQAELQWDPAVLAYDSETDLQPEGLSLCANPPVVQGNRLQTGCAREQGTTNFTGPIERATFHCLGNGTGNLHLVTLAEDPDFGTEALAAGGGGIETALADAQITCGQGGPAPTSTPTGPTPTPGGPTPTPGGPVATPTPLPPGYEAVDLTGGCNPVATTYPNATPIGTIAAAVGPAGNLEALWEFGSAGWLGYSPAYPQASDLSAENFLDVVFVCVTGTGQFVRPIV